MIVDGVQTAPCAGCGKVPGDAEIHVWKTSSPGRCVVLSPDDVCPAWTDGVHMFLAIYRDCEGFTGITPQPETKFSGLKSKRCACGAEVKRT